MLLHQPVAAQLEGCKEILAIKITSAPGTVEVNSDNSKVGMKAFGGHAESEFFTGDVLPGYDHGFNPNPDAATSIAADFLIKSLTE